MVLPLMFFLLPLLFPSSSSHPLFTIQRNGTTYSLNAGLCEGHSCGQDEGRGLCSNEIYYGRAAYYCKCNLPFTGQFCDETLRLNATLPDSPYSQCPFALYCTSVYGNGECNQECNTVECLYDGYECQVQPVCPEEEYCRDRFSDGICDNKCMLEECQFDGGDCFSKRDTMPGQLLIRLSTTAQDFMSLSHLFLFQLSRFLRATVVLSQDALGPLIWRWNEDEGRGERILKGQNSSLGIEVIFSVDLSRCSRVCLDSVDRVVGFISTAIASKSLPNSTLPLILSISSHPPSPSTPSLIFILCLSIGIVFILIAAIVGVILQQRKSRKRGIEAPIWMPPRRGDVASSVRPLKKPHLASPVTSILHQQAQGINPLNITDEDVNERDRRGRTPLMLAIGSERKEEELRETIEYLVKKGADVNAVDEDGWGALHHSFHKLRSPTFNRWLIAQGASTTVVDEKGRSLVYLSTQYNDLPNLKMILETGAIRLIDLADNNNRLPLSIAVSDCTLSITQCLIENGVNVNSNGEEQFDASIAHRYPLHLAVQFNNQDHVKILINKGCLMGVMDNRHRTALHYAVMYADLNMCIIIVEGGTPVDAMDDEERTAEDIAADWQMDEIRQYLISVRGRNEPYRRKRKEKRYSSDQGYGSEESQRHSFDEMNNAVPSNTVATPFSPLVLSSRESSEIPTMVQQPIFNTGLFIPLTRMGTLLHNNYPSVLTPSDRILNRSTPSLSLPPPFLPTGHYTQL